MQVFVESLSITHLINCAILYSSRDGVYHVLEELGVTVDGKIRITVCPSPYNPYLKEKDNIEDLPPLFQQLIHNNMDGQYVYCKILD
jgi:hypothetical protein